MSVSIATMGKFWPQLGGDTIIQRNEYGGTYWADARRHKPVVVVDSFSEEKKEISIEVTEIEET